MTAAARLFVTGTDTGVGKTLVSSALLTLLVRSGQQRSPGRSEDGCAPPRGADAVLRGRGATFKAVGMKPVAAGLELRGGEWVNDDVLQLQAAGNVDAPLAERCPCLLRQPMSPHLAAREEGVTITLAPLLAAYHALARRADAVVVEGAGGFCVPLGDELDGADLAVALGLPVVLVVGLRLGCLNHALLSAEAIRARGLVLAGWAASAIEPGMLALEGNLDTLRARLHAPLLGVVPHLSRPGAAEAACHLDLRALRAAV